MQFLNIYKKRTAELQRKIPTENLDVFDYADSIYNEEFDAIFSFYQEVLIRNSKFGIKPSILFFNADRNINAKAVKNGKHFIISFNAGTVVGLIQMFREYEDIILNENQQIFESSLDNPINELMYQFAVHYTFYHEMAHLIQKSTFLELGMDENLTSNHDFSELRHLLELDADEYSAISLGAHIIQYADNLFGATVTKDEIEELIVIGCSAILLYLLSFKTNRLDIYYEEHSHPHPIIRLNWIIFAIISYCENAYRKKAIQMSFNSGELMNKVLIFSRANIDKFFDGKDLISNYFQTIQQEALNIIRYYNKYEEFKKDNRKLAVHKWNLLASNKNQICKSIFIAKMKLGF